MRLCDIDEPRVGTLLHELVVPRDDDDPPTLAIYCIKQVDGGDVTLKMLDPQTLTYADWGTVDRQSIFASTLYDDQAEAVNAYVAECERAVVFASGATVSAARRYRNATRFWVDYRTPRKETTDAPQHPDPTAR